MKSLSLPTLDHEALYKACAKQTKNAVNRKQLIDMTNRIVNAGTVYHDAAEAGVLHSVASIAMTAGERALAGKLYDRRMVPRGGAGRYAYDEIHSSADYCPYCSFGEIYEIDHFLPKETFCDLNMLPLNLLPICHACNHIKSNKRPQTAKNQFLHPYFDQLPADVRWLFAKLSIQHGGPTLTYQVTLDENEHGDLAGRLHYHFTELQLEKRFRRQAAAILTELESEVVQRTYTLSGTQIAAHLENRAEQFAGQNLNSLEAAAYFAAAESKEYCEGKFRN